VVAVCSPWGSCRCSGSAGYGTQAAADRCTDSSTTPTASDSADHRPGTSPDKSAAECALAGIIGVSRGGCRKQQSDPDRAGGNRLLAHSLIPKLALIPSWKAKDPSMPTDHWLKRLLPFSLSEQTGRLSVPLWLGGCGAAPAQPAAPARRMGSGHLGANRSPRRGLPPARRRRAGHLPIYRHFSPKCCDRPRD
jgi:hypothetical protein